MAKTPHGSGPTIQTGSGSTNMVNIHFRDGKTELQASYGAGASNNSNTPAENSSADSAVPSSAAAPNLTDFLSFADTLLAWMAPSSGSVAAITSGAIADPVVAAPMPLNLQSELPAQSYSASPEVFQADLFALSADSFQFAAAKAPGPKPNGPNNELPIQTVNQGADAMAMANEIFGEGVQIVGATYYGDHLSAGIYSNGDAVAPKATPGDTGVIFSTGKAIDFTRAQGNSQQHPNQSSDTRGIDNEAGFNAAAGGSTYDASYLDVDFIPTTSVLSMQFVFSSELYPDFSNPQFQDFVGIWVNGTQVKMSVGDGDIDPNNLNPTQNVNMFIDNIGNQHNTEMDGFTITLSVKLVVNPGQVNTLRVGIADMGDSGYDSNLMIAGGSVQGGLLAVDDWVYVDANGSTNVNVLANDINGGPGTMRITHVNGQAVHSGSVVVLASGQTVTVNANGTFTLTGDGDVEDFDFSYTISNGLHTDTGFVNATSIPCFVVGTLIATPSGEVRVESLAPGDLVLTQDDGAQPLRWIGTRQVAAEGGFAPIHIRANTFGLHRDLLVSPLHRVLIQDTLAELLFGEPEVLVAAKDLVNDRSVTRRLGGDVTYVHLMFDRHQIVFSEGLPTESFLPGPQTSSSFEREVLDEICGIFPEIDPDTGTGYSSAARRTLKRYEAEVLRASVQAA